MNHDNFKHPRSQSPYDKASNQDKETKATVDARDIDFLKLFSCRYWCSKVCINKLEFINMFKHTFTHQHPNLEAKVHLLFFDKFPSPRKTKS